MAVLRHLRQLATTPPREWVTIGRIVFILTKVEIGLRRTTVDETARNIGVHVEPPSTAPPTGDVLLTESETRRLVLARRTFRHWPFSQTCLRRSLLVGALLVDRRPLLRLGVAKRDGVVSAHAWLEIEGHNLDPEGSASFRVLALERSQGPHLA